MSDVKQLIKRLEEVYRNLTPGAIERADLDGMAFTVRDAIEALTELEKELYETVELYEKVCGIIDSR